MGKMSKKNLDKLRRDDPKENFWEIDESDQWSVASDQEGIALKQQYPDELTDLFSRTFPASPEKDAARRERIYAAWLKVDPEIRTGNPVWLYSEKDAGKFVFIFRNGQKVRVEL